VLEGKLHQSELPATGVKAILDVGAGTGAWATAMARTHPGAEVIATDLTPPELPEGTAPPNLKVQWQDAGADEWPFEAGRFDFVHARMLGAGVDNWTAFVAKCWTHLAPGGILELSNASHPYRADRAEADSGSASALIRFSSVLEESWSRGGPDWQSVHRIAETLSDHGFADAREHTFRWPLGEWADNDRQRRVGALTMRNFTRFIQGMGVPLLTKDGFMAQTDAEELVAAALEDLRANHVANRYYIEMYVRFFFLFLFLFSYHLLLAGAEC
jgi:SAM-dependent methyltransferase